jgi:hypothetical protein
VCGVGHRSNVVVDDDDDDDDDANRRRPLSRQKYP